MDWIAFTQNVGFPAAVLAALGTAVWRVIVWLAGVVTRAYEEVVQPAATKHFQFLDAATAAQQQMAESFSSMRGDVADLKRTQLELLESVRGKGGTT